MRFFEVQEYLVQADRNLIVIKKEKLPVKGWYIHFIGRKHNLKANLTYHDN
jgi:hypothetical protein